MSLRILHISTRLILGGSQENVLLSCEGQAELGHDVHLAFGPIYGPEGSILKNVHAFNNKLAQSVSDGPARPITTHELPHMVREIHPLKDHFCFHRDLKNLLSEIDPDIVHTHSSKAGILGRWAAWKHLKKNGRPGVVHTIHGPPFMPVEGPPLSRLKIRAKNQLYTRAERFAAKRCHSLVSVAAAMTQQFLARGIGDPDLYTTVHSGMDTEAFLTPAQGESRTDMRTELDFDDDNFVVGTVARIAEHKGHDDILDALEPDLRDPDSPLRLLWVGDGWWRERLERRANDIGVLGKLTITGMVPPGRVPAMMRAMDVLAHPSYREGLPRTVPQAMLAGVLPIATDTDGTGEACRDMDTGRLVPVGDPQALGDAIRWAKDHPDEVARMVERGRSWAADTFAADRMVNELETVYANVLDRLPRRTRG